MRWVRRHRQSLWLAITLTFVGLALLRGLSRFGGVDGLREALGFDVQSNTTRSPSTDQPGVPRDIPPVPPASDLPPPPHTSSGTAVVVDLPAGPEVFGSAAACKRWLGRHGSATVVAGRLLSWNLRWFPYGQPPGSEKPVSVTTDVDWLACLLASQGASIVALQEVVADSTGQEVLSQLARRLGELRGGRKIAVHLDPCPSTHQRLAFLIDAAAHPHVSVRGVAGINPIPGMCGGKLRPGLELRAPSLPVAVLNVHLDSGTEPRDASHRRKSLEAIADWAGAHSGAVVLGDFNMMGCPECDPPRTPEQEMTLARAQGLEALDRGSDGQQQPACTSYYQGRGNALDRAYSLGLVPPRARAAVLGPCVELGCRRAPKRNSRAALPALSDHCPIRIDLDLP